MKHLADDIVFLMKLHKFWICVSRSVMSHSLRPHELSPARLLSPYNSPSKNIGVGSRSLLHGIFPTQGSNPSLLHCSLQILCSLSHQSFWGETSSLLGASLVAQIVNQVTWPKERTMTRKPGILLRLLGKKHTLSDRDVKNRTWTGNHLATVGETLRLKARYWYQETEINQFLMILFEALGSAMPKFLITEPADVLVPQVHREPSLSKPVWIKFLSWQRALSESEQVHFPSLLFCSVDLLSIQQTLKI